MNTLSLSNGSIRIDRHRRNTTSMSLSSTMRNVSEAIQITMASITHFNRFF